MSDTSRYVRALQDAAEAQGYGAISVQTLEHIVQDYIRRFRPPMAPGEPYTFHPSPLVPVSPVSSTGDNVVRLFP
jgi:hypothetical protein